MMTSWILKSMDLTEILKKAKNKLNDPFWIGFNCLKARITSRRQFTFYQYILRNSWFSFYQPGKDERLSQPWSHPVVLNMGLLDWNADIQISQEQNIFSSDKKNHLHIKGYFMAKNSFVVQLTFKGFELTYDCLIFSFCVVFIQYSQYGTCVVNFNLLE